MIHAATFIFDYTRPIHIFIIHNNDNISNFCLNCSNIVIPYCVSTAPASSKQHVSAAIRYETPIALLKIDIKVDYKLNTSATITTLYSIVVPAFALGLALDFILP
jgi:hypothetical protein